MPDLSATARLGTVSPAVDIGATLGSYALVELLGAGAMGRVYRGQHVLLGREVAIKVLNPEYVARADIVQRFFREARVVNDIDHEHIVEVTDFVEAPGLAYLVMELLDGSSLRELMKQRGRKYLPLRRMLGIMSQVCDALDAAHEKGVVHRDLKPDNVFVVNRDGGDFVKVLDFGVAKLRDSLDRAETSAGVILGTPHYMAPEQALGKDVDGQADVWAAGVVLYELLAGAVPFTAGSFVELANCIREQQPKPLPAKTPRGERIPPALAAVVTRCLEKRPSERFRSMAALAGALRATPASQPPTGGRFLRLLAASVLAAAVAVGGVAGIRYWTPRRLAAALEPAGRATRALVRDAPVLAAPPDPKPPPSSDASAPRSPEGGGPLTIESDAPAPRTPASTSAGQSSAASRAASRSHEGATAAAPQRRATVELLLRSTPPGARVVRLDTGERLGKTPIRMNVARKAARIWLEMRLDGYGPVKFAVDLRHDTTANVTFKRVTKKAGRRR